MIPWKFQIQTLFSVKETLDFVAYVAKDVTDWRACYVIKCGHERAQTIITTMGQAFELRYKDFYGSEPWVDANMEAVNLNLNSLFQWHCKNESTKFDQENKHGKLWSRVL